jgi:hypothetical protein
VVAGILKTDDMLSDFFLKKTCRPAFKKIKKI